MAWQRNNAGEKSSRKIEIGWLNWSNNEYHQVRTKNGEGTRHATVEKTTSVAQILEMGKELFFPNGHSTKGKVEDFSFSVCDFKRNHIPLDDTVSKLYEQTKLKLLRFYICTKEEAPLTDDFSEVDEFSEDSLSKDSSDLGICCPIIMCSLTWILCFLKCMHFLIICQSPELTGGLPQDVHLPLSSTIGQTLLHTQSINEEGMQSIQDREPQGLLSNSSRQRSPSPIADNSGNPEIPRRASVHRVKVVEDLLPVFMDRDIMSLTLKIEIVNEKAIDDAGVSREVYTTFWEQLLEQCEGETERVPRLRPDFGEAEWQAVGRIWVKGLLDHGVMPARLSKAFILACIHGIDSVDVDILMSSFLNYLSLVEKSAIEKALHGTLEESDEEDLLDLFTRMGSHSLPPKKNFEAAIHTMVHSPRAKIYIQPNLLNKESVLSLYESKKATGKRVSQLLETTKVTLSQREQTTFSHLQRFVKSADETKAEQILRFCTGSSVICVDKILVCFNVETGLNRRPVAHTCGATLEVPCTYSSYPEFRTEFDNILSSNYFDMDIL
ncbi:hypothetical protein Q5P01_006013 [Channa striata]|uniref:HECT domain-containing protein n=1 Tax=Channa striata TaxID=64152 RepID=A0AA88SWL2_CHASR|nr:hypothetical protein Q5P01_006013 [Channa striata]